MRRKGFRKTEDPEKMPVVTTGIQMSRGQTQGAPQRESLTGAQASADESAVAKLVNEFILRERQ